MIYLSQLNVYKSYNAVLCGILKRQECSARFRFPPPWLVFNNISDGAIALLSWFPGCEVELSATLLWLKPLRFGSCVFLLLFPKSQNYSSKK